MVEASELLRGRTAVLGDHDGNCQVADGLTQCPQPGFSEGRGVSGQAPVEVRARAGWRESPRPPPTPHSGLAEGWGLEVGLGAEGAPALLPLLPARMPRPRLQGALWWFLLKKELAVVHRPPGLGMQPGPPGGCSESPSRAVQEPQHRHDHREKVLPQGWLPPDSAPGSGFQGPAPQREALLPGRPPAVLPGAGGRGPGVPGPRRASSYVRGLLL